MTDIHIVGHVCVDLAPALRGVPDITPGVLTEVGPMGIHIGGVVGNGARTALGMGHTAALAATVGDDELGALCRSSLEQTHPGTVVFDSSEHNATSYSVVVQPPGEDRSFWHHTGANDDFDGTCELVGASVVHFGYPTLVPGMTRDGGRPTIDVFRRARSQGSATSLDLAYCAENSSLRSYDWDGYFANVLPITDVFCPSWDDITSARGQSGNWVRGHVEAAAAEFLQMGAAVILLTVGEAGCYLATGSAERLAHFARAVGADPGRWSGCSEWIPAAPVERFVSSNGAGDTFKVAFLLSALSAADAASAARHAATVVARHIGGLPLANDPTVK